MDSLPSVEEMMDAMASPVIPMDSIREEEQSGDMKTHTEILLDLIKSVQRLEDKMDRMDSGASAPVAADPNLFGFVTSGQLDF